MRQWISNEGATIAKLLEHGALWVVDKLPPVGSPKRYVWEVDAEENDSANKLIRRWANTSLPKNDQKRQHRFGEMAQSSGPSVLVINDAHLLSGSLLVHMRSFSEQLAPVILVGDVLIISAKIINRKNAAEFMMRSSFCITPTKLF
jgi:hypothetical protein